MMVSRTRNQHPVFWLSALALGCVAPASGQSYPVKPIRIVTAEPGAGNDIAARLIAQGLVVRLHEQIVVDNRPTILTGEIVAKAPADGYTLLVNGNAIWVGPLFQKAAYDPVKDFSPITTLISSPNILVINPQVPAQSVRELIALAKAKPGTLNYASSGIGAVTHLAAELFKSMAAIDIVRVPYKGAGPALNAVIGGEAQMMFPTAGSVTPHLKSGRLRALAVVSAKQSALAPGLQTIAASGLPGYEMETIIGMFAPAKTPAAVVNKLNMESTAYLNQVDVKEKIFGMGLEAAPSSPAQFAAAIKSDMTKLGKLVKDAGLKVD